MTEKWTQLFSCLAQAAQSTDPYSSALIELPTRLGALGLVQPFDWPHWKVPFPELYEVWQLDIEQCTKQITRIVRSDRFAEGNLYSATRSGSLAILCLVAFERTQGKRAPVLTAA